MVTHAKGVNCGVVEWMKRIILQLFGHSERMKGGEPVKEVYVSKGVGPNRRERPLGRSMDRVKEYLCERGATRGGRLDQARRKCFLIWRWKLFCRGHPLGLCSRREQGVRVIDRYIASVFFFFFFFFYVFAYSACRPLMGA